MNELGPFGWVASGIVVAVIFPVLSGFVRNEFKPTAAVDPPSWVKKYGALLLFSLVTALICLAVWRSTYPSDTLPWFTMFLFAFGWESAIEKFQKKGP